MGRLWWLQYFIAKIGHQVRTSNFDFYHFERSIVFFLRIGHFQIYPCFAHHKSSKKAINHGQNAASATPHTIKPATQPIPSDDWPTSTTSSSIACEIPLSFGCLHHELLPPPSHQQNHDNPPTIQERIRLHPSLNTHLSWPLHPSNALAATCGMKQLEKRDIIGVYQPILLVRLCHHHR
jgi:hypothetical protein